MLVTAYKDEGDRTGLLIGEANARRYFRKNSPSIELQLDDLHIQCTLAPDFWQGRPQIHDPRLSEWLKFKAGRGPAGRAPLQLAMVRSGRGTFVVRPEAALRYQAFGAEVSMPPKRDERLPLGSTELASRSVA